MKTDEPLGKMDTTAYRSAVMRCKYVDLDRIDIAEAVKALSQYMANPRATHTSFLKRLCRYLKGRPRMLLRYRRQARRNAGIRVYTDSDWAGDLRTRRSTSGLVVLRGSHSLRHSSTLQSVLALSSAEAEFYALTKGAAYALGIQSYFRDWGVELPITCYTDASSGLSFATRRGLGRIRHVETRFLWLQDRVALKHLRIAKVGTDDNPADILTKPMTREKLDKFCAMIGQESATEETVGCR